MLRSTLTPLAFLVLSACADEAGMLVAPDHPLIDNTSQALASQSRGSFGSDVLSDLADVRRATARFHNIEAAMEAGYTVWIPDPFAPNATCPSSPEGNMGYHLVNVGLRGGAANPAAGDAVLDPLQPEMLLYEKRPSGKLHLVGVEYIVFTAAWERVNGAGAAPPVLFGQTVPLSVHTFPGNANPIPHYEIHVWLWSNNPLGMFHHWNPTVLC